MSCPHGLGWVVHASAGRDRPSIGTPSGFRDQAGTRGPVEGDQLTIEAYWEPGDGTSPRWGEYGGELHSGPTVPRDRQDSGALVTRTHASRGRCDGDFAPLRVAGGPQGAAPAQGGRGEHEAARRELPGQRATDRDLTPAGG